MKNIYDFEQHRPPVLNENLLRAEMEKRRLRRQTALLALAGILLQVVVFLFGYAAMDWYPWLTLLCFSYLIISTTGCGVITVSYYHKGEINL